MSDTKEIFQDILKLVGDDSQSHVARMVGIKKLAEHGLGVVKATVTGPNAEEVRKKARAEEDARTKAQADALAAAEAAKAKPAAEAKPTAVGAGHGSQAGDPVQKPHTAPAGSPAK